MSLSFSLHFLLLLFTSVAFSKRLANETSTPNLRIEGLTKTYFEGPITSWPRKLTAIQTDDGYTHICDGVEGGGENRKPFNAALDAFDQASKTHPRFNYTLFYDGDMTDFGIISVAKDDSNSNGFEYQWGMLINWKINEDYGNPFGISGCRNQVHDGDDILFAYVPYSTGENTVFLKVTPSATIVKKGSSILFTITDGLTGTIQPSATINGVKANQNGQVKVKYPTRGQFSFKAQLEGAVRSELVKITVK